MIQPFDPTEEASTPYRPPLIYEIVESEQLPCFDAQLTTKHLFLSDEQVRRFDHQVAAWRPIAHLVFVAGIVLRNFVLFVPAPVGKILGPVCLLAQLPANLAVVLGFRRAYVKLLASTFEFWFLMLSASTWIICACAYVPDARAVVFLSLGVDFGNMVLIEAYDSSTMMTFFVAIAGSGYLLAMTTGVALNLVPSANRDIVLLPRPIYTITVRDIFVNTMWTMIMLAIRLAHRTYNAPKKAEGCVLTTWTRSNGYRCRVRLVARVPSDRVEVLCGPPTTIATQVSTDTPTVNAEACVIKMRFTKVPTLFHASDTVVRGAIQFRFTHWRLWTLYACGGIGYASSCFILLSPFDIDDTRGRPSAAAMFTILGLCATLLFLSVFTCCSQRALVRTLFTSFDFVFLYAQLVADHLSVCDVLLWNWIHCCSLLTSFLWMHWVLTLDALTPDMKARLGRRSWFATLVLMLNLGKSLGFALDVFVWNRLQVENHALLRQVIGGREVNFWVFPFLLSRQITVFIWCLRLLHRLWSRKSEDDLVMLLGNVERNYQ